MFIQVKESDGQEKGLRADHIVAVWTKNNDTVGVEDTKGRHYEVVTIPHKDLNGEEWLTNYHPTKLEVESYITYTVQLKYHP